ncbi:MAG: ABC transporter ATP-binding protein [Phycisphaeraceae bacterium]|nr:MAG: ABC transporter ATP-binding protein [Phycisphaeraceae bacterium]
MPEATAGAPTTATPTPTGGGGAVLEVRDLVVNYGAVRALHGVSLSVARGEIVTLIGCNGAGKSTTLRTISGLLRPVSGSVRFEGEPLAKVPAHEIVRRGVVQCPEGRGVFANLTVDENLELGAYTRNDDHAADRERALTLFPRLRERLRQNAGTLSGGEQQMLAMARALLARPKLLLLDEPSLGLAPQIVQTIFSIIREINASGTTILLVEQNAHMALTVAHRAYVLEVGRIAMEGPAATLAASDEVRKAYLGIG